MTSGYDTPPIELGVLHERRERVFLVLAGLFLGTLAMLNILGITRFLVLGSWGPVDAGSSFQLGVPNFDASAWNFAVAVGVLPYPMTFLCTDLISEFYGRRRANFVVWVGLLLNLWVIFILWLGGVLPGFADFDPTTGGLKTHTEGEQPLYFELRALAFGAVTASMIAYLAAQFVDVYVFHFWKKLTAGKHLWLRNNGSTMVSQAIDSIAVILITYYVGGFDNTITDQTVVVTFLVSLIVTSYVFKFLAAALDTPLIYLAVKLLSPYLQIDPMRDHVADKEEAALGQR